MVESRGFEQGKNQRWLTAAMFQFSAALCFAVSGRAEIRCVFSLDMVFVCCAPVKFTSVLITSRGTPAYPVSVILYGHPSPAIGCWGIGEKSHPRQSSASVGHSTVRHRQHSRTQKQVRTCG